MRRGGVRGGLPGAGAAALGVLLPLFRTAGTGAQDAEGARLFRQRCGACHGIETGQNRTGPHLKGVSGRPAGSVEGAPYSAALQNSGLVWDAATLDAFLAAPRQAVPGTTMTVAVPNAAQRAAIVAYLGTL